jgi:hypothetical protein
MTVCSLQSDLAGQNRENGPKFANLQESKSGNSLYSRLYGGEQDIRTFSTGRFAANG